MEDRATDVRPGRGNREMILPEREHSEQSERSERNGEERPRFRASMSDRKNEWQAIRSMRSKWPGVVLGVVLSVLLLLLVYLLWLSYIDQVRRAEINTRNLAAIFEARFDATMRRIDADLKALSEKIPAAAMSQKAVRFYELDVNTNLDSRLFNMGEMTGYRVHDAHGDTLYSSNSQSVQRVNIADRAYFHRLRDDPDAGLVFSEVIAGKSTHRQVLVIARALHDQRGRFSGIVHGMVDLEYYRNQFRSLDLGAHGVVALRRTDTHAKVIRWPDSSGTDNQPLGADHPAVQLMLSGEREITLHYEDPLDRVARIMSVERMQNYPFYFSVAVGKEDILAGWYRQVMVVGVSTFLLFGLVSVLLFRLGRMRVREAGILDNLARSKSQFRELAQLVPVGICHFDNTGRYTYVNDRFVSISGRTRDELLEGNLLDFVHPDDVEIIRSAWKSNGKPGGAFVCEYRFMKPGGAVMHLLGEVQTGVNAEGHVVGYVAALTDISLLKQTEEELMLAKQEAEAANIAKTRFLAAASHDLRQPIQAINLFRDALGRTNLSEEQKTISRFLSMSVRSLGELLYSLLDISKLDAGQIKPQMKAVLVEDLFKMIDAEFSTLARQKNLRFKLCYPFAEVVLFTDSTLMMSVLRNLIDNALKYTERGGILVGFRRRGGKAVIQVWDTGIGIEPQYGERIFDECFQVGNPARDRTKGLGLGLSIVRRTARLLNAEVTYRSRPARGTVFDVVLPLAVDEGARDEQARQEMRVDSQDYGEEDLSCLRGWRVVVIEDDLMVAKSLELSLGELGIRVQFYLTGEKALEAPGILGADYYISDFNLPGLNGLQVLDAIQERSSRPINAVLVTGETSPERVEMTSSSRWAVFFKPVELSALLRIMKSAADARIVQWS